MDINLTSLPYQILVTDLSGNLYPLDPNLVVNNASELDKCYEGMMFYSKDDKSFQVVKKVNSFGKCTESKKMLDVESEELENFITDDSLSSALEDYVKQEYVDNAVASVTENGSIVTKDELASKLGDFALKSEIPSLDEYVKGADVASTYATKEEIPSLEGYAKSDDVASTYATKEELDAAKIGGDADLSEYAKSADVEATYAKKEEIPSLDGYAKSADVESIYATIESTYATKEEIPSLDGYAKSVDVASTYATKEELDAAKIGGDADLSEYAKSADVAATYATKDEIPSLDGYAKSEDIASTYATQEYVDKKSSSVYKYVGSVATFDELKETVVIDSNIGNVFNVEEDGMNYAWNGSEWDALGSTIDLSEYAKTSVIESTYATKEELEAAKIGGDADLSEYAKSADVAATYAAKDEIPSLDGYAKSEDIPSLEGYATEEYVLTLISSVYKYVGSVDTYKDLPTIINSTTNVKLNVGDVYDVKSDGMNYAWNGSEWDALGSTIDLSNYVTTETFNSTIGSASDSDATNPSTGIYKYVDDKVSEIDLSEYAKTSDIPSTNDFVTTETFNSTIGSLKTPFTAASGMYKYVDDKVASVDISSQLNNYSTTEEVEKMILKATESPEINAFGLFKVNGVATTPTDGVVTLYCGNVYEISGYLEGCIKFEGTASNTTIILNNVYIKSEGSYGIYYGLEEKALIVNVKENSYNYIELPTVNDDNKSDEGKYAAILSDNNMEVRGVGYLAIFNKNAGHGIKASKLTISGLPHIYVEAVHDAFHGSKQLDVENGVLVVKAANDAFGSGDDGIIRIFGGSYQLSGLKESAFDAKQPYVTIPAVYEFTSIVEGTSITYEMSVGDSDTDHPYDSTVWQGIVDGTYVFEDGTTYTLSEAEYTMHSKIFDKDFALLSGSDSLDIDLPILSSSDFGEGHVYQCDSEDGTFIEVLAVDNVYTCTQAYIKVSGYVNGLINANIASAELVLDNAYVEYNGEGATLYYSISSKSFQIKTAKNSEVCYVINSSTSAQDAIYSLNNVKVNPKANCALYIHSDNGNGVNGSSNSIYNGSGNVYVLDCGVYGLIGSEVCFGAEANTYESGKEYEGNAYVIGSGTSDVYARVSSKGKKSTIDTDGSGMLGFAYTEKIGVESGSSTPEHIIDNNDCLYYKSNISTTDVTGGVLFVADETSHEDYSDKLSGVWKYVHKLELMIKALS